MMKPTMTLSILLLLLSAGHAEAQNTGAQATPQTQSAAPAAVRGAATPARSGAARTGGRGAQGGGDRRGGGQAQARPPAPAANSSVGVLGDSNGDGLLDRNSRGGDSAALPGIPMLHNALGIAAGTPISVRLQQVVESGHARNGDTVHAVLAQAVGKLPTGSPVSLTVVAAAPAGQLSSSGTLSLQVVSINGEQVLSQVITAEGKEGQKTLADDAPARGTEAVFTPDQPITLPAA